MIQSLYIRDFALVEELQIRFSPGLNILTGETGAGKSIIVNAIAQICGERSSTDLIRSGADKAVIEAEILLPERNNLARVVKELEIDAEPGSLVLIRKEIQARGISRIFINDSPVPLNKVSLLSFYLIDFHGQHQHQRLLHPENHIEYLDAYAGLVKDVEEFSTMLSRMQELIRERDRMREEQYKRTQMHDMYRYQLSELTKANLDEEEWEELHKELKRLNNIEVIHELANDINELLYQGEANAAGLMARAEQDLQKISRYDQQFADMLDSLRNARDTVEEIGRFAQEYLVGLHFDPERLEQIQQRIYQLEYLLKKYQKATIRDLIEYRNEIEHFTVDLAEYEERITELEKKIEKIHGDLQEFGLKLSKSRTHAAKEFAEVISQRLSQLGMPHARFRVKKEYLLKEGGAFTVEGRQVEADRRGFDRVLFEFSANPGEDFRPLHKIASGGEISRIMLTLKSLLAGVDGIPTMIFDEIDVGVSGKVAQIVGQRMAQLSRNHQIVCVTHLPQIAAFAQKHFKVFKHTDNQRTRVVIEALDDERRVQELAGLLGGKALAPQALENARHLLDEAHQLSDIDN